MTEFRVQRRLPANHPALPGHFPGQPIVPGVLLLDWVLEAILDSLRPECAGRDPIETFMVETLPAVKFLRALQAEQMLEIIWRREGMDFRFRGETAEGPILNGSLRLRRQ